MKTNLKFIPVILLAVTTLFVGCEKEEEMVQMDEKNIVEVAQSAGQFNVLLQAAVKAGLADFLSTENNLTVFAPTDAAFAALLKDLGLTSLDQIDAATLGNILNQHIHFFHKREIPLRIPCILEYRNNIGSLMNYP